MKILVVDDYESAAFVTGHMFEMLGHEVRLAYSGNEALKKAKAFKPTFILLDIGMPEMDGFTLAKEIREIDKKIPILFLTAKAMKEDKLEGFSLGADDYLTKPFNPEELEELVKKNLYPIHYAIEW